MPLLAVPCKAGDVSRRHFLRFDPASNLGSGFASRRSAWRAELTRRGNPCVRERASAGCAVGPTRLRRRAHELGLGCLRARFRSHPLPIRSAERSPPHPTSIRVDAALDGGGNRIAASGRVGRGIRRWSWVGLSLLISGPPERSADQLRAFLYRHLVPGLGLGILDEIPTRGATP